MRDYVGAPQQEVYRLGLSGTPDIELPLSWMSLRVTGGQQELSVSCPVTSLAMIEAIQARATGDLIVYRGYRFGDGREQLDEMVRAPLQTIRTDRGAHSMNVSLSGANTLVSTPLSTRTLRDITYRAVSGGARRVRCRPDTYLTVGTMALLGGGESLVTREITITVGPSMAVMEISE